MTTKFWKPIGSSKLIRHPRWDFYALVNSTGRVVPPTPVHRSPAFAVSVFFSKQCEDRPNNSDTDWWDLHMQIRCSTSATETDWIFIVANFYYCYQVYNKGRRYRRRPAMTDGQLTANIRRWLFGAYSSPAAGDIFAHTTPNWVKLLPIYESDIGETVGLLISRPSSPL